MCGRVQSSEERLRHSHPFRKTNEADQVWSSGSWQRPEAQSVYLVSKKMAHEVEDGLLNMEDGQKGLDDACQTIGCLFSLTMTSCRN